MLSPPHENLYDTTGDRKRSTLFSLKTPLDLGKRLENQSLAYINYSVYVHDNNLN